MLNEAQKFTGTPQIIFIGSILPLLALALAGISFFFLYKHWHNLEPIHTCWALFYGTQALNLIANDIALLLGHFTSFSSCPQNIIQFFTGILFYFSVILLQADRWAAIYFNSKYKGLISNKTAIAGCSVAFLIDLVISILVFLIDSSHLACAHPPSLRLTRRTTIYLVGTFRMTAVVLTTAVSCYAVRTKMKLNKVTPRLQLGHLKREEDGAEEKVNRVRNTTDVFYRAQPPNTNVEAPVMQADTPVKEENNALNLVKEIIESNKMPLIIIISSLCTPVIGWIYAGCEEENFCDGFLSKVKFFGILELFLIFVQILVTTANITKFKDVLYTLV